MRKRSQNPPCEKCGREMVLLFDLWHCWKCDGYSDVIHSVPDAKKAKTKKRTIRAAKYPAT